jgi:hypothetical protein
MLTTWPGRWRRFTAGSPPPGLKPWLDSGRLRSTPVPLWNGTLEGWRGTISWPWRWAFWRNGWTVVRPLPRPRRRSPAQAARWNSTRTMQGRTMSLGVFTLQSCGSAAFGGSWPSGSWGEVAWPGRRGRRRSFTSHLRNPGRRGWPITTGNWRPCTGTLDGRSWPTTKLSMCWPSSPAPGRRAPGRRRGSSWPAIPPDRRAQRLRGMPGRE